jgi:hypothetical protein
VVAVTLLPGLRAVTYHLVRALTKAHGVRNIPFTFNHHSTRAEERITFRTLLAETQLPHIKVAADYKFSGPHHLFGHAPPPFSIHAAA